MRLVRDFSLSALNAGFVTVLVGFTSSVVIVFQAAQSLGASSAQMASWMLALGLGMGLFGIGLSWRTRAPIALAWSTSGAAMLSASVSGVSMGEAVACFIATGVAISVVGFSGWFERAINRIPLPLAAGMLSGVLLRFGIEAFASVDRARALVIAMFVTYLVGRRLFPRYAVITALLIGTGIAVSQGSLHFDKVGFELARPVFVEPVWSWRSLIGVGLPLFIVTMASQNVPAVAVLRASGYQVPVSRAIGWTGVATFLLAPFGGFTINLATITAAICVGREAHEDPNKRYMAAVFAGVFYTVVGLFGAAVASLLAAFPRELVLGIAGLALLGTIGNGLASAMGQADEREPALITFLVTASGLTLFGIGAAFWGLVAGVIAWLVLGRKSVVQSSVQRAPALRTQEPAQNAVAGAAPVRAAP